MARSKTPSSADAADIDFATPARNPNRTALLKLGRDLTAFRPAPRVIRPVKAVPTVFIQYDRATRVGGHPVQRWTTVHGPSNHGKTTFVHGLGLSFLQLDHVYAFVDAEYTTPIDWIQGLMGDEYVRHPGFYAMHPRTYEQTVDAVRELLNKMDALKKAKKGEEPILPKSTCALIGVDSLRKLVPKNILKKVLKGADNKKGSIDGMGGRAAQIKAAINASWLDEMTPRLHQSQAAIVAIARESQDTEASSRDRQFGNDWKMTGGNAVMFDASLVIRVTRSAWVKDKEQVVGERHKLTIRKTKVGGKDDKNIVCYFHTSNGMLIPEGFDAARDTLELAVSYGIVDKNGATYSWHDCKWKGENVAVKKLTNAPSALKKMQAEVRARFSKDEQLPEEAA